MRVHAASKGLIVWQRNLNPRSSDKTRPLFVLREQRESVFLTESKGEAFLRDVFMCAQLFRGLPCCSYE